MKTLFFTLVTTLVSANVNAAPSEAQQAKCKVKVEKALAKSARALGMGKGVGHLGGTEVLGTKVLSNGEIGYVYSGGILTKEDIEGYISGSGAETVVLYKSDGKCQIVSLRIDTGADF